MMCERLIEYDNTLYSGSVQVSANTLVSKRTTEVWNGVHRMHMK